MTNWRAWPTDGKLLLFDRDTGVNQLFSGKETAHFRQIAPRSIQLALTNACNKTCDFCYRPLKARSQWSYDEVLDFFQFCDEWGVLEIALGGGEPTLFPRQHDSKNHNQNKNKHIHKCSRFIPLRSKFQNTRDPTFWGFCGLRHRSQHLEKLTLRQRGICRAPVFT